MDDFMTAVRTVKRDGDAKPEPHLNAVQTRATPRIDTRDRNNQADQKAAQQGFLQPASKDANQVTSAKDALQVFRSQPSTETVLSILKQLSSPGILEDGFDLDAPGPLQAQIINTLVGSTVPHFWSSLAKNDKFILIGCLTNVAGMNAVIARLKLLTGQTRGQEALNHHLALAELLEVARLLFQAPDAISNIWEGLHNHADNQVKRDLAWKELVNLLGSGKVTSIVAEAEDAVRSADSKAKTTWLSNGTEYADWLGRSLARLASWRPSSDMRSSSQSAAQLLARAFGLGYPVALVKSLHCEILRGTIEHGLQDHCARLCDLLGALQSHNKRQYLDISLTWLSTLPSAEQGTSEEETSKAVTAVTAVLHQIIKDQDTLQHHLLSTLNDATSNTSLSRTVRRASIAVLASLVPEDLESAVEKQLTSFGEPLFIKHAPIIQQESLAQTVLLAAGYIHRANPMALLMAARGSGHMQGVSNRLEASNTRARWLGMIVGTALSSLVDKDGMKMKFGTSDMETEEAKWYLDLTKVNDKVGSLQDFIRLLDSQETQSLRPKKRSAKAQVMPMINGKQTFGPLRPPEKAQTEVEGQKVTEILDTDSEDEDDLKPYAKPDSDPEDSDEDATLVNRHKSRRPVYIRDLMAMLRDTEKHDRFQLGVKHAAPLIRRKTGFGKEVTDHAEELARILCSLQDPFNTDDFEDLRLQALIAVILSQPSVIAPWLGRQAFTGEYSIAQRCLMLTALGLSGRELAGLQEPDELNPKLSNTEFPSKRLPPHLHAIYGNSATKSDATQPRLQAAHASLEKQLVQPLALRAADQSTAHLNAVKVRNFSSRLNSDQRSKRKSAPNQLAKVFAEAYFYPLISRYQQEIAAYSSGSVYYSTPFLLVTLLKTLALLFHASGPATLNLPQLTTDFWNLLLSLRVFAVSDITVLEAVLFGFLTIFEVNDGGEGKRRVAQEMPKQLVETQQWVEMVFERTEGGNLVQEDGEGEEAKVRTLAAGVLVRAGEVVEGYRRELMGVYDGV